MCKREQKEDRETGAGVVGIGEGKKKIERNEEQKREMHQSNCTCSDTERHRTFRLSPVALLPVAAVRRADAEEIVEPNLWRGSAQHDPVVSRTLSRVFTKQV